MDENRNDVLNGSAENAETQTKPVQTGEQAAEGINTAENAVQTEAAPAKKTDIKKEIFSWIMVVVVAYILAFCITHFVIIKTEVISGSMISTLNIGDRVIGNRLSYVFSEPDRGDIIFFAYPMDETKTYVKRIIGCPGDTVVITDGKVYINGSADPLNEPYLNDRMKGSFGPYTVPESSYFVMGDNRNISVDSREWGFVTRDEIYAKAWLRYKPSIDLVRSATYE